MPDPGLNYTEYLTGLERDSGGIGIRVKESLLSQYSISTLDDELDGILWVQFMGSIYGGFNTHKKKEKKESLKMSLCPTLSNINICLYTTFTCPPIACSFLFMHSCL